MITALSWLLSACTIAVMWLAGNGSRWAWYLGIVIQPLWIVFALASGAYGLIPLSIALLGVYGRNLWRWYERRTVERLERQARQVQQDEVRAVLEKIEEEEETTENIWDQKPRYLIAEDVVGVYVKRTPTEAIRFTGTNATAIVAFTGANVPMRHVFEDLQIDTPHGKVMAKPGDWILKDNSGQFYPCTDEVFRATYEPKEEQHD